MTVYTSRNPPPPPSPPSSPARRRRRVPEPRWIVFAVVLSLFASMLLVNGLVTGEFTQDGAAASTADTDRVPAAALDGGPIIQTDGSTTTTVSVPSRQIVLTFDDGPDPRYTPEILDVLAKYDVPGVFFQIGSEISRYPSVAKQVKDAGHEIGIHTFTHPEMSTKSQPRAASASLKVAASSAPIPRSSQSVPLKRMPSGFSSGHAARTASNTSSGKRMRFDISPP